MRLSVTRDGGAVYALLPACLGAVEAGLRGRPPSLPLARLAVALAGDLVKPPMRAKAEAYFFISFVMPP